jgi:hypothetical protein
MNVAISANFSVRNWSMVASHFCGVRKRSSEQLTQSVGQHGVVRVERLRDLAAQEVAELVEDLAVERARRRDQLVDQRPEPTLRGAHDREVVRWRRREGRGGGASTADRCGEGDSRARTLPELRHAAPPSGRERYVSRGAG